MALIQSLKEQKFVFSKNLNEDSFTDLSDVLTKGQSAAWGIAKFALECLMDEEIEVIASYDDVDKEAFDRDLKLVDDLKEGLITSYAYLAGALSVSIILNADDMSDSEIMDLFKRFDKLIVNNIRHHAGRDANDNRLGTYGTIYFIFAESSKARRFNDNLLKKCYESHLIKSAYTSAVTIDCQSGTLTQGRAAFGLKWNGGGNCSMIKKKISEVL